MQNEEAVRQKKEKENCSTQGRRLGGVARSRAGHGEIKEAERQMEGTVQSDRDEVAKGEAC